ncbi:hypothetical protein [Halovivax cerinus]|uniref:Uncharacterized protein n=1 Tax=Halovivax cerinus TaxID=1487865 RepID=A0ABD5NKJ1_9EURY|nr:hypothetical protein [Halovivax cerinus]
MSTQMDTRARRGLGGTLNWLVGGAIGGLVGSAVFGAILWLVEPTIVREDIPAIYGVDPGSIGLLFHLIHGLVLGIVFGFLVTRDPVLGTLSADVETDAIAAMGMHTRFALAGFVFGLLVWTLLPVISQSILIAVSGGGESVFPAAAFSSLVGHVLYGFLLGWLFSIVVAVGPAAAGTTNPFDEPVDRR